ncbi:MAG TPA: EamA family transporter [Victivallales bacterium]|nr:EamA family transporter [Victivallales bacterium]
MSVTAILLIILSAFVHAGWNLLSKKTTPSTSFFYLCNVVGCIVLLPIFILYWKSLFLFPVEVWILLIFTGISMSVYYIALATAYRHGDLSIAYPIARSSPIIVVAIVTFILAQGHTITFLCVIGILLITAGCFILPMKNFSDIKLKNYLNITCLFALISAFGTAGYSIIDDNSLSILTHTNTIRLSVVQITLLYSFFECIFIFSWLSIFILFYKKEHTNFLNVFKMQKKNALLAGIGIIVAYSLVLISMSFATNVSYVVAFRQLSIPIGALGGIFLLKEPRYSTKYIAILTIFIGLILVAL